MSKPLPQNPEAERAVIGGVLLEDQAYWEVADLIPDESYFYDIQHRTIYQAIQALHNAGETIDQVSVGTWLDEHDKLDRAGGAYQISEITDATPSAANIEYYAQEVRKYALWRRLIKRLRQYAQQAYDREAPPEQLMTDLAAEFHDLQTGGVADILPIKETLDAAFQRFLDIREGDLPGWQTGIDVIDRRLMGFEPSDYIVLLGAPSNGKTALALQIILNLARDGVPVGFIPLEGSPAKLSYRLLVNASGVHPENADDQDVEHASQTLNKLADLPIYYRAVQSMNESQYRAAVQYLVQRHGVQVVVIDYLQLMSTDAENRTNQMRIASEAVTHVGAENDIATLALSQPLKGVDGSLPQMNDIRESGRIAQDATKIIGIAAGSRMQAPDEYNELQGLSDEELELTTLLNFCMVKDGAPGIEKLRVRPELFKFYEFETRYTDTSNNGAANVPDEFK